VSLTLDGPGGTITVPGSVLLQIAVRAAEGVDGLQVRRKRAIDVESRSVRLEVSAGRGEALIAQGQRVQHEIASALERTCGLDVTVDVVFEELR
jgi:uncharacterized alkaline shock family protein YloU